jgi:putative SOS response-associated peptidase YedK
MCYSAQVWADYHKYERLGGELKIHDFVKMVGWARRQGVWRKAFPTQLRQMILAKAVDDRELGALIATSDIEAVESLQAIITKQSERLAGAEAKLASGKPTKKAETDKRVATNEIAKAQNSLVRLWDDTPVTEDFGRIWPGWVAFVLITDPETRERRIVPMVYRCRIPGWTEADLKKKDGTYNARRDSLNTAWRKVFTYNHGVVVVRKFYESVHLHRNQGRELVPGETAQNVEICFEPASGHELYIPCLWVWTPPEEEKGGYYSFAAITRDPPPEVSAAGHDRCLITLKPENVDSWLDPDPSRRPELLRVLDDYANEYFDHSLMVKGQDEAV